MAGATFTGNQHQCMWLKKRWYSSTMNTKDYEYGGSATKDKLTTFIHEFCHRIVNYLTYLWHYSNLKTTFNEKHNTKAEKNMTDVRN